MSLSDIDLCSRALVKVGANSISSFDDGTTESMVAASFYSIVRDGLLSRYPWNFATTQKRLSRLAQAPLADFLNAFALPTDCLRVLAAGSGGTGYGSEYRVREAQLHAHAESITITYLCRPPEKWFPPYFRMALIARLAAEFCIPLTDSTSRWKNLSDLAEDELRSAKLADALEGTPPSIQDFTLVEGRG